MLCNLFSSGCRSDVNAVNVTFRVVDNDGCPVCGSVFRLTMTDVDDYPRYIHAISNRNGCATFCNVCPGMYSLYQLAAAWGHDPDQRFDPDPDHPDGYSLEVSVDNNGCVRIEGLTLRVFTAINPRNNAASGAEPYPFEMERIDESSVVIRGTGDACCTVEVCFPGNRMCCATVDRGNEWRVNVPRSLTLTDGDWVSATICCPCKPRQTIKCQVGEDCGS